MKIIFVHIPKTAGNSIAKAYGNQGIKMWGHNLKVKGYTRFPESCIAINANRFSFISRHFLTSFCIVRNPWARTFSAYNYLQKGGLSVDDASDFDKYLSEYEDFNDFVLYGLSNASAHQVHFRPQLFWVASNDGVLMVDRVLKLENIELELNEFMMEVGIPSVELPKLNRSENDNYKRAFSKEAIQKVREVYSKDIETFGYDF